MSEMGNPISMVERVAEAIYQRYCNRAPPHEDDFVGMARAAIEAMREPTQAMMDAWGGMPDEPFSPTDDDVCRHGWQQMIDAALSEGQTQKEDKP